MIKAQSLILRTFLAVGLMTILATLVLAQKIEKQGVSVVPREAERRVDVYIDGQPFTAYIWPETLKKPVLYPLRTATGTLLTRGFPMDPRPGERVDHPHHVGLWFNYGDVNGVDFWNNSTALKPEEQKKMGTIHHRRVVRAEGGKQRGELVVASEWVMPDGKPVMQEETTYVFHSGPNNFRAIDRITKLTALDSKVTMRDNKEGVLGIRVARELEHPSDKPDVYTDAAGRPTPVAKLDNTGVVGKYISSENQIGDDVWGTRGRWTMLSSTIKGEPVTLAILDHPQNVGHPTYWHARGYGLFAANPLGQKVFSTDKKEPQTRELNYQLEPKQSTVFRHRILLLSSAMTPEQMEAQHKRFTAEVK